MIVHLLAQDPYHVSLTFSAVDGGGKVADAIGESFDSILMTASRGIDPDLNLEDWKREAKAVDYRLLVSSGWGGRRQIHGAYFQLQRRGQRV